MSTMKERLAKAEQRIATAERVYFDSAVDESLHARAALVRYGPHHQITERHAAAARLFVNALYILGEDHGVEVLPELHGRVEAAADELAKAATAS